MAVWNGSDWQNIGSGINQGDELSSIGVDGMMLHGTDLYVMGGFAKASDSFSNLMARLDLKPEPIVVTNTNDEAERLRQALADVEGLGTIIFHVAMSGSITPDSPYVLTDPASITINGDIDGDKVPDITIDGTTIGQSSLPTFSINGGELTLHALNIVKGASEGSGEDDEASSCGLTISYSSMSDNITGGSGGAIYFDGGDLTIQQSNLYRNVAGNKECGLCYR